MGNNPGPICWNLSAPAPFDRSRAAAPAGSTKSLVLSNISDMAARISSSLTVTTVSTWRLVISRELTAVADRGYFRPNFTLLRSILLRFALFLNGSRRSARLFLLLVVANDAFHGTEAEDRAFFTAYCDGDGT